MRIVDISALYSPHGGGIRTYTRLHLAAVAQLGVDLTVIVPSADASIETVSPQARPVNVPTASTAIGAAIAALPALRAASALSARNVPTMDQHFNALFTRYRTILAGRRIAA